MTPTTKPKSKKPLHPPKCSNCNGVVWCGTCARCSGCSCGCFRCPECDRKVAATRPYCEVCVTCNPCCKCRNAPRYTPPRNLHILDTTGYISRLPRLLGVEMEIGEWKNLHPGAPIPSLHYTTTHDWSVKPSETEMVISPMRRDSFVRGMLSLSREMFLGGCVVNETCAMHVHVGGEDLSYWDIRRLLEVYLRCESDIYSKLIAPHRSSATTAVHYCQMMGVPHTGPCDRCNRYDAQYPGQRHSPEPLATTLRRMWQARTTSDLKVCLLRMLYGIENPSHTPDAISHRKGGRYEFARYFGLNLHSWMYRLTVEWRMKEATADPMEMVCWPLWCGWFTHAITRMTDAEAQSDAVGVKYITEKYMPPILREWIKSKGVV